MLRKEWLQAKKQTNPEITKLIDEFGGETRRPINSFIWDWYKLDREKDLRCIECNNQFQCDDKYNMIFCNDCLGEKISWKHKTLGKEFYVYELWQDDLLYIGYSQDPVARFVAHKQDGKQFDSMRIIEGFNCKTYALYIEGKLISLKKPGLNKIQPKKETLLPKCLACRCAECMLAL